MARPCTDCGVTVNGSGQLGINGVTSVAYPYTTQTGSPNDIYCDTASNELWLKPWATAWGYIAGVALSGYSGANPLTSTTYTPLTGMTFSFTAIAGRNYRFTWITSFGSSASTCVLTELLNINGTTFSAAQQNFTPSAYATISGIAVMNTGSTLAIPTTIVSGTNTVALSYNLSAAGSITPNMSSSFPWRMWVEDAGPA